MQSFLHQHPFLLKHQNKIEGVLSCFDRVILRGYLPICHPRGLEGLLYHRGMLLKDFRQFAPEMAERLKAHAQELARSRGRPYQHLPKAERKEELARRIAERDGVREGLVCVLSCLETCRTFRLAYGEGRPRLSSDYRRCLVIYYFHIDRHFGLMHVKVETWFPFTIQVYVNGHAWLARKLDQQGIGYQQLDNAFVHLDDAAAAQRWADRFPRLHWRRLLNRWARLVNPLLADLLWGQEYYWVIDQAELATDVLFTSRSALAGLYPALVEQATLRMSAEDVLGFLGRKLHPSFQQEVRTERKPGFVDGTRRVPGMRVKHHLGANRLKMYDKHGRVLRIETVINQPREFWVRRRQRGRRTLAWQPLRKGVGWFWRYAQVSLAANRRYLEALAVVDDRRPAEQLLARVTRPVGAGRRRRRALQPMSPRDLALFRAVLRGEHHLRGFRNQDLARQLFHSPPTDPLQRRRRSAQVTRWLGLLRAHGLVAKVPRARRYHLTRAGLRIMSAAIYIGCTALPLTLSAAA